MGVKMIKVDERTHARLVELAVEQGTMIGALVGEFAGARHTRAEWATIGQQTGDYLREQLGFDPTPDEWSAWEAEHAVIMTGLDREFAARRQVRRRPRERSRERSDGSWLFALGYLLDTTALAVLGSSSGQPHDSTSTPSMTTALHSSTPLATDAPKEHPLFVKTCCACILRCMGLVPCGYHRRP